MSRQTHNLAEISVNFQTMGKNGGNIILINQFKSLPLHRHYESTRPTSAIQ